MVKCRVCNTAKAFEPLFDPACGCAGKAHVACLAMLAQKRQRESRCHRGWTRCTRCYRLYKDRKVVELMFRLWSMVATDPDDKIRFYGECAAMMKRRKQPLHAARALQAQLKLYRAKGENVATSTAMLLSLINFGGRHYEAGNVVQATQVFEWIGTKSGSPYAWLGLENLAVTCARRDSFTKAKIALAKALEFTTIDLQARARIELRYAEVCLRTFDYCAAQGLAAGANVEMWNKTAKVPNPVELVKERAISGIALFENLIVLS
jgi:hypothetical protein